MKNAHKVRLAIGLAFAGGVFIGDALARKAMRIQYEQNKELISNGLVSAVSKALENNWSTEQLNDELQRELDFLKIIKG